MPDVTLASESIEGPIESSRRLRAGGVLLVEQGGRGGVADYTGCLAAALAQRGIPVTIATARDHLYGSPAGVTIAPIFVYARGHSRLTRLARQLRLGPLLNGLLFLAALPRLVPLARRAAITHVQGWERISLGVFTTLLLRAVGAKLVYTAHNTFDRHSTMLSSPMLFPALAHQTIVHTQGDRQRLRTEATVIPHGHYGDVAGGPAAIDPVTVRSELGIDPDAPVALMFGHLREDKGLDDLLDAAALAPSWHVLIAGREEGALALAATRLSSPALAGRVSVHEGFHDMDAVARFFAAADLVAIPYRRASQSGVVHLAYGFARPVAVYPVGGLVEAVVPDETGWVCEKATPEALAAVLDEAAALGHDGLRRLGAEGRRWSAERFDWAPIAEATEAVYLKALEAGVAR